MHTGLPLSNTSVLVLSRDAIVGDISESAEVEGVLPGDFSACVALRIEFLGSAPGCMWWVPLRSLSMTDSMLSGEQVCRRQGAEVS